MSRFFGEVRQVGYVVPDIEEAMRYWAEVLGVGPWFYAPKVPVEKFAYRGAASAPETSVALANSGPLQIELIQQRNTAPTMYQDFLRAGNLGLQHLAYWTETYDEDLARLTAQGFKVAMNGEVGANGRFCYFEETAMHPGAVIELSEVKGPKGKLFRLIREASEGWDGTSPVRPFPDLSTL
jgi:catechol 2,3-dioxygenase-like lactoylglutathione lyase family enzyme